MFRSLDNYCEESDAASTPRISEQESDSLARHPLIGWSWLNAMSNDRIMRRPGRQDIIRTQCSCNSMNRATIDNKRIEDGDFVIIDAAVRSPKDGDIVLSVIDRMANIKEFHKDKINEQLV